MLHDDPVLCVALSWDGEMVASGCQAGTINVRPRAACD